LLDKISILEIKKTKLTNLDDIKNVNFELNLLTDALNKSNIHNHDINQLFNELKRDWVNSESIPSSFVINILIFLV